MTKEETIELAKQSGMNYRNFEDEFYSGNTDGVWIEHLEAFAKLAVETEREACALIAEIESFRELPKQKPKGKLLLTAITQIMCGTIIAQIIRERGQK
jgi:hypothetical protein